jgi:hypothetical protein
MLAEYESLYESVLDGRVHLPQRAPLRRAA